MNTPIEDLPNRLRRAVEKVRSEAQASQSRGASARANLFISPAYDDNLNPLPVTIGFPALDGEDGVEMGVTLEPELWSALTALWEHNAERAAYQYSAATVEGAFPEVFK